MKRQVNIFMHEFVIHTHLMLYFFPGRFSKCEVEAKKTIMMDCLLECGINNRCHPIVGLDSFLHTHKSSRSRKSKKVLIILKMFFYFFEPSFWYSAVCVSTGNNISCCSRKPCVSCGRCALGCFVNKNYFRKAFDNLYGFVSRIIIDKKNFLWF